MVGGWGYHRLSTLHKHHHSVGKKSNRIRHNSYSYDRGRRGKSRKCIYARGLVLDTFGDVRAALPCDWECCECALVGLTLDLPVSPELRLVRLAVGSITSASLLPLEPPEPGGEPECAQPDTQRGASVTEEIGSAVVGDGMPAFEGEFGMGVSVAMGGIVTPPSRPPLPLPPLLPAEPEVLIGGGF